MESLTKPPKPYNLDDPKAGRKIRAYYKRLNERLEGNYELSTEEKQDLVQIGLLIATYDKKAAEEAKLQAALNEALEQALHDKEQAQIELAAIQQERLALLARSDLPRQEQLEELAKLSQAEAAFTRKLQLAQGVIDDSQPLVKIEEGEEEQEEEEEEEEEEAVGGDTIFLSGDEAEGEGEGEQPPQPATPAAPVPTPAQGPGAPAPAPAPGAPAPVRPGAPVPPGAPGAGPPAPPAPPPPPGPGPFGVRINRMANPKGNELLSIPLFTGSEADPEIWLDLIDRAGQTYRWNNDRKPGVACLRLTGDALVWLDSQKKQGHRLEDDNWGDFKTLFLARFKPRDDTIKATEAIVNLRQRPNEKIAAFFDRCVVAVEAKNRPGFTDAQRAAGWYRDVFFTDVYSFMCAGMLTPLRKAVMGSSNPPRTAEDLRTMAIETEAALAAQHSINEIADEAEKKKEENEQKVEEVKENDESKLDKLEKEIAAIKTGLKCFRCGKVGHLKRECTQPPAQSPNNPGSRGRGRGRGRGTFNQNFRGGGRGRGYTRGRGYGYGGGRGRGGYTPPAYFGQPNFYNQYGHYGQYGNQNQGQRFGVNHIQQQNYDSGPPQSHANPDLWEIVHPN